MDAAIFRYQNIEAMIYGIFRYLIIDSSFKKITKFRTELVVDSLATQPP